MLQIKKNNSNRLRSRSAKIASKQAASLHTAQQRLSSIARQPSGAFFEDHLDEFYAGVFPINSNFKNGICETARDENDPLLSLTQSWWKN